MLKVSRPVNANIQEQLGSSIINQRKQLECSVRFGLRCAETHVFKLFSLFIAELADEYASGSP